MKPKIFRTIIHNSEFIMLKKGVASLAATLILGAVIISIALTIGLLAYLLNFTNLGIRLSAEAFSAAQAGVEEGLMRVLRNDHQAPSWQNGEYNSNLFPGGPSAAVRICKDKIGNVIDLCNGISTPGKYEIISVGTAFVKKRQMAAVVQVDATTRQMTVESIIEKPL